MGAESYYTNLTNDCDALREQNFIVGFAYRNDHNEVIPACKWRCKDGQYSRIKDQQYNLQINNTSVRDARSKAQAIHGTDYVQCAVGLFIKCGVDADLIAVDYDTKALSDPIDIDTYYENLFMLLGPPTVKSKSGGYHWWFRAPKDIELLPKKRCGKNDCVEILGDGQLVYGGSNIHFSGKQYEWLADYTKIPDWNPAILTLPSILGTDTTVGDTNRPDSRFGFDATEIEIINKLLFDDSATIPCGHRDGLSRKLLSSMWYSGATESEMMDAAVVLASRCAMREGDNINPLFLQDKVSRILSVKPTVDRTFAFKRVRWDGIELDPPIEVDGKQVNFLPLDPTDPQWSRAAERYFVQGVKAAAEKVAKKKRKEKADDDDGEDKENAVTKQHRIKNEMAQYELKWDTESWWEWKGKYFKNIKSEQVQNKMLSIVFEDTNFYTKVERLMKIDSQFLEAEGTWDSTDLIPMNNGMFDLEEGKIVAEHAPKFLNTYCMKLNIDDSEGYSCPLWIKTLEEVFADDHRKIEVLKQQFGYTLCNSMLARKGFIWLGLTAKNAKTLCADVLKAFFPEDAVGSADLHSFGTGDSSAGYHIANLRGMKLNISGDLSKEDFNAATVGFLKRAIDGSNLTGRQIKTAVSDFPCRTKLFVLTNNDTYIQGDMSNGIFDRFYILKFNQRYDDKDFAAGIPNCHPETKGLAEKIISTELEDIFRWAVEGYHELKANRFVFPLIEESEAENDRLRQDSNPIYDFFDTIYEVTYSDWEAASYTEVWTKYKSYCEMNGYLKRKITSFNRDLVQFDAKLTALNEGHTKDNRGTVGGARMRVIKGIKLIGGNKNVAKKFTGSDPNTNHLADIDLSDIDC